MKYYYTIRLEMRGALRDEDEAAEIIEQFIKEMNYTFFENEKDWVEELECLEEALDGMEPEEVAKLTFETLQRFPLVNALIWAESFDEYHADEDRISICVSPKAYATKSFSWNLLESLAYEEMKEKEVNVQ